MQPLATVPVQPASCFLADILTDAVEQAFNPSHHNVCHLIVIEISNWVLTSKYSCLTLVRIRVTSWLSLSTKQVDGNRSPPVDMLSTKQEDVIVISDYAVH